MKITDNKVRFQQPAELRTKASSLQESAAAEKALALEAQKEVVVAKDTWVGANAAAKDLQGEAAKLRAEAAALGAAIGGRGLHANENVARGLRTVMEKLGKVAGLVGLQMETTVTLKNDPQANAAAEKLLQLAAQKDAAAAAKLALATNAHAQATAALSKMAGHETTAAAHLVMASTLLLQAKGSEQLSSLADSAKRAGATVKAVLSEVGHEVGQQLKAEGTRAWGELKGALSELLHAGAGALVKAAVVFGEEKTGLTASSSKALARLPVHPSELKAVVDDSIKTVEKVRVLYVDSQGNAAPRLAPSAKADPFYTEFAAEKPVLYVDSKGNAAPTLPPKPSAKDVRTGPALMHTGAGPGLMDTVKPSSIKAKDVSVRLPLEVASKPAPTAPSRIDVPLPGQKKASESLIALRFAAEAAGIDWSDKNSGALKTSLAHAGLPFAVKNGASPFEVKAAVMRSLGLPEGKDRENVRSFDLGALRQALASRGVTFGSLEPQRPTLGVTTQSRAFKTKVVIELTHARDRLMSKLNITPAEWARVSQPERQTQFQFGYRKDDGSEAKTTGYRILFSTILGPGKGGLRVVPNLDLDTVGALASEMPAKTAIMNQALGGAKGGWQDDASKLSDGEFARAMRGYVEGLMTAGKAEGRLALGPGIDIPAPDVGTSHPRVPLMDIAVDAYLGWLVENGTKQVGDLVVPAELKAVKRDAGDGLSTPYLDRYLQLKPKGNVGLLATFTGKSVEGGGSLGRGNATGLGVALSTLEVLKHKGLVPKNATEMTGQTVAVHGYGNVGRGAVIAFLDVGAKVTSIAEFDGTAFAIEKKGGFTKDDAALLDAFKAKHGTLRGFPGTTERTLEQFWSAKVDIMAPCAREGVITEEVANTIRAGIVVEGANGPTTHEGDTILAGKGITVIPDIFANAAGVTVSSYEMQQNLKGEHWSLEQVNAKLATDISTAFARLAKAQKENAGTLRSAAFDVALTDFILGVRAKA